MLINEVESVVGLTKKSIRYYEDIGLLFPKRNNVNGYRIYDDEDIRQLKLIKFLRGLDISINDIKKLSNGSISLVDCMNEHIKDIDKEKENMNLIKDMCVEIANSGFSYNDIKIDDYFIKINQFNKNGMIRRVDDGKVKKYLDPIVSGLIFSLFFVFLIVMIIWAQNEDPLPLPFFIFIMSLFIIPILGIIINLFVRIREIKGGEEDEASKY